MKKFVITMGLALVMAVIVLSGCTANQQNQVELTSEEVAMQYFTIEHGEGDYEIEVSGEKEDWIDFIVYEGDQVVGLFGVDKSYAIQEIDRNS